MGEIKINKTKILLSLALALLSLKIYLGAVLGYFFARFVSGKLDSVIFNFGNYRFHFHHWIMGALGMFAFLIFTFSPLLSEIILGFLSGLIFEGITSYQDWYRILTRRRKD